MLNKKQQKRVDKIVKEFQKLDIFEQLNILFDLFNVEERPRIRKSIRDTAIKLLRKEMSL